MRRTITTSALVLATILVAAPAEAVRESDEGATARGRLHCEIGVVGFDSAHHVRSDVFTNGRLVQSRTSRETLPFDVTAWGYFDSSGTERRNRLRLNAITADGVPRRVTLNRTPRGLRIGKVRKYQQRSFTHRLYADGGSYYAYTVDGGTMKRWALTRFRDGDERFAHPVKVRGGLGELTSLQAGTFGEVHGVESEILYATDTAGRLLQVVVPVKHPSRARVHKLARSGYAGVTELAWSYCGDQRDHHALIAIDPAGNRATWSTVRHALTRPRATLRGDVTGVTDWNLAAGF